MGFPHGSPLELLFGGMGELGGLVRKLQLDLEMLKLFHYPLKPVHTHIFKMEKCMEKPTGNMKTLLKTG